MLVSSAATLLANWLFAGRKKLSGPITLLCAAAELCLPSLEGMLTESCRQLIAAMALVALAGFSPSTVDHD